MNNITTVIYSEVWAVCECCNIVNHSKNRIYIEQFTTGFDMFDPPMVAGASFSFI